MGTKDELTKLDVWECQTDEGEALCTHYEAYHARRCDEGSEVREGTWWLKRERRDSPIGVRAHLAQVVR